MIKISEYNILCLFLSYFLIFKGSATNKLIKKGYNLDIFRYRSNFKLENLVLVCYLQFINLYSKSNYHMWDS